MTAAAVSDAALIIPYWFQRRQFPLSICETNNNNKTINDRLDLQSEWEDIMQRAEQLLKLDETEEEGASSSSLSDVESSQAEITRPIYLYEEDETWNEFCEGLPLE